MNGDPSPAPKKPNKTLLIVLSSVVGFILLCIVLNILGSHSDSFMPGPTEGPTLDPQAAAAYAATAYTNMYGYNLDTTSGQAHALDCTKYSGMKLVLPSGDNAFIPCPADSAVLSSVSPDKLPSPLAEGITFVSGMDVQVSPSLSGMVSVKFTIPLAYFNKQDKLTILHWNGTDWEDLGPGQTINAQAPTTGVFVLASR